jgi:O-antigen/teichoic acid export membrane protein
MGTVSAETKLETDTPALNQTRSHIRGSSLLLVGRIIAMGINFGVQVLTVRYLSKGDYGALAYALSVVSMAAIIALFGLDKAIVRFIPIYHERKDYQKMFGTVFMTIGAIIGIGIGLVTLAFGLRGFLTNSIVNDPLSVSLLLILIAMAPMDALDSVFQGLLAVFAKPRAIFFRRHILGPGLKLAVVLLVIAARSNVSFIAAGYLVGGLLGIIVYIMMLARVLREAGLVRYLNLREMKLPVREIFSFSVPLLSSDVVAVVRTTMVVVLLEYFRSTTSVAEFRAVVPVAGLNLLVLQSFKFLYTPLAARMFAREDREGINKLYWQTAVWIALISFPIFVLSFSLARPLTILLFGDRYADSGLLLALLAFGNYFNAALGFNTYTLRVYGRVGYIVLADVLTTLASLGLSVILIPRYGALGAAISASGTLVIYNLLNHAGLLLRTGIDLFQWRYLRVYISIAVSALALFFVQEVLAPHFIVSILLAGAVSIGLVRFNRRVLDIIGMFPELGKLPLVGPLFGL